MTAHLDAPAPRVNTTRFRQAHEADWARLDALIARIEKRGVRSLDDGELMALPLLYRATLSSLASARESSLDLALQRYLQALGTRAYFQIYGVPTSAARQIAHFFAHAWPAAVRALWREIAVGAALMLAGALIAWWLVRADPTWFYGLMPDGMAQGRDPSASAADLRATLGSADGHGENGLTVFATFLFTHNAQIAIFAFALGFAFAVPTALLMLYNGVMLGAMVAVFGAKGLGLSFAGWLSIHGTTELFAIALAGAAGFRIGLAVAFPGRLSRMDAAVAAGRVGAPVVAGTVVMLAVAGLLEGIGRQTVTGDGARFAIGGAMLVGWIAYFALVGRERA